MSYSIVIRFPDEIQAALQEAARQQDRSINSLVRVAVARYLAAQPTPAQAPEQSASSAGAAPDAPTLSARHVSPVAAAG